MSTSPHLQRSQSSAFNQVSGAARPQLSLKPPAPFSIRLNADERAYLEGMAGNKPLGAYIRGRLLGDRQAQRKTSRKPKIDDQQYASLLASLGESRLSSNINQLAKHANMGTLDVSRDVEQELKDACGAVLAMREALFIALGLRTGGQ